MVFHVTCHHQWFPHRNRFLTFLARKLTVTLIDINLTSLLPSVFILLLALNIWKVCWVVVPSGLLLIVIMARFRRIPLPALCNILGLICGRPLVVLTPVFMVVLMLLSETLPSIVESWTPLGGSILANSQLWIECWILWVRWCLIPLVLMFVFDQSL